MVGAGAALGGAAIGAERKQQAPPERLEVIDSSAPQAAPTVAAGPPAAQRRTVGKSGATTAVADRRDDYGQLLGLALLFFALLAGLVFALTQFGGDDAPLGGASGDGALTDGGTIDAGDAAAVDATGTSTTRFPAIAGQSGDLQTRAQTSLQAAGLDNVAIEVDGDVVRLVGDVESQDDEERAVNVIKAMPGVAEEIAEGMSVESALVVGAAASTDDTQGPAPVGTDPSYTG
jgi:hypothetical protein